MNPAWALIIANIIWGAAAPIFKYSLTNIPPFTLAFIRFFFASVIFIPFILKFNWKRLSVRDWLIICLGGFFGISINIAFFFLGLQKGISINAPVIASTGPILLFIASIIFLKEKLKTKVLFGMITSLLGAIIIIFSPLIFNGKTQGEIGIFEANVFYFIATIGSVAAPLILKNVLQKFGPYIVCFISFLFSSLTFLPFALPELNRWSFNQLNIAGIIGIIFGVILCSALAYFLFYYGVAKIKTQEVGLFTYIDPVAAVLIAIPLLGEYPDLYFFIGSILIFLGIFIAENRIHYHPINLIKNFANI